MRRLTAAFLLLLLAALTANAQNTIDSKTAKLRKLDGYFPLFWDDENGRVLMRVDRFNDDFIYQVSLAEGVGSNPIGLDRNQLGQTHLLHFERVGPKVLLVEPNSHFRAIGGDEAQQRSVSDSFAQSVLWGFKAEASDGDSALIDATDFFLSDQHGVAARIRDAQQGTYMLSAERSAIYLPHTKSFPLNTEVESTLTFVTDAKPGELVSGVAPVATIVTVREHHSFVKLPEPGYKPRRIDPRVGFFDVEIYDYASPFGQPLEKRFIARHRLEKKDPKAAVSEPVQPLVYYVDPGAPEPIRSAILEGASWWSEAFEAAGFRNAFIVKVLPPGADPLDIRYNMINWIHRSTRGWSFGEAVIDPRTGEIIKGNVCLGSLRIRQDVLIGSGLVPQFEGPTGASTSAEAMALARIRQLAAHEVGHTLGLDHNMAASTQGRASVMDYPAPNIKIVDGKLDFSDAYARGIGTYDKFAIRYAYSQFAPDANEEVELEKIADHGPLFVKDADALPVSAAHPLGSVWDSGSDPVASLRHEFDVRRIALDHFGLGNLREREPLSSLEETLLPLYLHHRYQLEAAAKSVGGLEYVYAVKGDVPPNPRAIVAPARQREAIKAIVSTLDPSFLALPQRIIDLIPPRAYGYEGGIAELFEKHTAPAFDPITAAMASADITIGALLEPHRDARLVEFHAENAANPPLAEVMDAMIEATMHAGDGYAGAITRATRALLAQRLMELADNADADAQVRAEAAAALRRMIVRVADSEGITDESELASRQATRDEINRFLSRPAHPRTVPKPPVVPPGPPI